MAHPFGQETKPRTPKAVKGYETLTEFDDKPEIDGVDDWIEQQYIKDSDSKTEFTVVRDGKVVSSGKIGKDKNRKQDASLFNSSWDNFKNTFKDQL